MWSSSSYFATMRNKPEDKDKVTGQKDMSSVMPPRLRICQPWSPCLLFGLLVSEVIHFLSLETVEMSLLGLPRGQAHPNCCTGQPPASRNPEAGFCGGKYSTFSCHIEYGGEYTINNK